MSVDNELETLKAEVETLKQALMDIEPVGNAIRNAGNDIVDKVSQRGLKRIIRRVLAFPSTDTAKVIDNNEGALTQAIFEKLKVIQQQVNIATQIAKREQIIVEKTKGEN